MNHWSKTISQIQEGDSEALRTALQHLEKNMKSKLHYTTPAERENLLQELRIKTYHVLTTFSFQKAPTLWEWREQVEKRNNHSVFENADSR